MILGHGDDIFSYEGIKHNFSSNIMSRMHLDALYEHLYQSMPLIGSYPEPDARSLTDLWARSMGIPADSLCVTNGATEAIYLIAQVYRESRSTIFVPTFSEYADACRLNAHQTIEVCSTTELRVGKGELCWLCNPNNPTGQVFDHDWLVGLITSNPDCLFIVDQSYAPYTLAKVIDATWAVCQPNVLILHSMTKQFGIPGLRIGGVSGHPRLIGRLRRSRMPWTVNTLAVEAGKYLLTNCDTCRIPVAELIAERRRVASAFESTRQIDSWPSDTHMLLSRLHTGQAKSLKRYLATEKGILIRDASNFSGLDARCFRIAVQRPTENNLLIETIREWILCTC